MAGKLNVAFLWHMHQPYYRDPKTGKYFLPWVRLHGLKGYTDMFAAVNKFPEIQVTFNFVPALLEQIDDLASGRDIDLYFDLSLKPAKDLETAEKKLILKHFFSANWANMVVKYPRYRDLLNKRGIKFNENNVEEAIKRYTPQDFCDLQMWFNLTWFGWSAEETYPQITEFKRQDRGYTEEEKQELLSLQLRVLGEIIPKYRNSWTEKRIEISTTPFYHPILPLLIDSKCAKISQPYDILPGISFHRPEDAKEQLLRGKAYAAQHFGQEPVGLWPSEGSVSPEVCELAGEVGFRWLATDENVLLATLNGQIREDVLYKAYRSSENGPALIFRDHFISDAIGFRYARNSPKNSVDDLFGHLNNIALSQSNPSESVVAIILDGENAWEYFPDGGLRFFEELYSRLNNHPHLQTCTVGSYLENHPPSTVLPPVFPASWINGSFRIWIGDSVKNMAWDKLARTAAFLEEHINDKVGIEIIQKAYDNLFIAEGSDWFWWYGEPNHSIFEEEFDYLFRANLIQIYRDFGLEPPPDLLQPIRVGERELSNLAFFPVNPIIDGKETSFYEWAGAIHITADEFSGSMNFVSNIISRLFYGFSENSLCIRLDPSDRFLSTKDFKVLIHINSNKKHLYEIENFDQQRMVEVVVIREEAPISNAKAAFVNILEVEIPFEELPQTESSYSFAISINQEALEIERWPREGFYQCPKPTPEYLSYNWII
jgi:alpha-amylase/alpha-mannosidase (GH57 family)